MSERRACSVVELPRATCRYKSEHVEDPQLRKDLRQLAGEWPRYGYRMLHGLLRRKGWAINHKLVYRLYRAEGLTVRRRIRKHIAASRRLHLDTPAKPDQRWSMDFVSDALADGRVLVHELARREDYDRNLETPLQRGEAAQLAVRIDTAGILKPLPRTDIIAGRKRGAGQTSGLPLKLLVETALDRF